MFPVQVVLKLSLQKMLEKHCGKKGFCFQIVVSLLHRLLHSTWLSRSAATSAWALIQHSTSAVPMASPASGSCSGSWGRTRGFWRSWQCFGSFSGCWNGECADILQCTEGYTDDLYSFLDVLLYYYHTRLKIIIKIRWFFQRLRKILVCVIYDMPVQFSKYWNPWCGIGQWIIINSQLSLLTLLSEGSFNWH